MTAVHEDVHHWTQQQDQERQCVQKMCAMLSKQEIENSGDQTDRRQPVGRKPKTVIRSTHHRRSDYSCS
jgi:hypothetical protein